MARTGPSAPLLGVGESPPPPRAGSGYGTVATSNSTATTTAAATQRLVLNAEVGDDSGPLLSASADGGGVGSGKDVGDSDVDDDILGLPFQGHSSGPRMHARAPPMPTFAYHAHHGGVVAHATSRRPRAPLPATRSVCFSLSQRATHSLEA
jgi:hypothetical protein